MFFGFDGGEFFLFLFLLFFFSSGLKTSGKQILISGWMVDVDLYVEGGRKRRFSNGGRGFPLLSVGEEIFKFNLGIKSCCGCLGEDLLQRGFLD